MKLVLSQGVFDLLHIGHLRHLQEARKLGDYLVVGVTMDPYVGKGPTRPVLPQEERLEMICALRPVNAASLVKDCIDAMRRWKPDILAKDYRYQQIGLLRAELDYCARHRIEIVYTRPNARTTTSIVEKIRCA